MFNSARFHTIGTSFRLRILPNRIPDDSAAGIAVYLYDVFVEVFEVVLGGIRPSDYVLLSLTSPCLDRAVNIGYMQRSDFTLERFFTAILAVLQSAEDFDLMEGMTVKVFHVRLPQGGGRFKNPSVVDSKELVLRKRSTITIPEEGGQPNTCLARAIVTAKLYATNDPLYTLHG